MRKSLLMNRVGIIGSGPAGLSAAIYASRAGLKVTIFDEMLPGGQVNLTETVENYPGFSNIKGMELAARFKEHALNFGTKLISKKIVKINPLSRMQIKLIADDETVYKFNSIIIATGASPKKLGVEGETKFTGCGVSYCATCDGPFFKEKIVAVIGGGNSACEEADYLTKFARHVFIVHRRDKLRADKILQDRVFKNSKISFLWNQTLHKIIGEDKVTEIELKNKITGEIYTKKCDGVFIFIGYKPRTEFINKIIKTFDDGHIITDEHLMTSIPGVFAAGDVRNREIKQIVVAAAEGAIAAINVRKYLSSLAQEKEQ